MIKKGIISKVLEVIPFFVHSNIMFHDSEQINIIEETRSANNCFTGNSDILIVTIRNFFQSWFGRDEEKITSDRSTEI